MPRNTDFLEKNSDGYTWGFCLVVFVGGIIGYLWITGSYVNNKICTRSNSFVILSLLWFILMLLIYLRVNKSLKYIIKRKYFNWIYIFIIPLVSIYAEEMMWNPFISEMKAKNFALNYLLLFVLTMGVLLILQKAWITYSLIMTLCGLYGVINYYVLEFKGCPPLYNDLVASETALTVMGQYSYWLSDSIISGAFLIVGGGIILAYFMPDDIIVPREKNIMIKLGGLCGLIFCFVLAYNTNISSIFGIGISGWMPVSSFYTNGAPITMFISAQNVKMQKPDNYNDLYVREILAKYEEKGSESLNNSPTVIVIMNESFSDLGVLGDFESDEYLSKFYGMESYVMRGNVYVSVCGGGTCNSEFEFLTGGSMANVNVGIYPYQSFDLSESFNLSELFGDYGYETVAMHPYYATNWNRVRVYDWFGFDRFISESDMVDIRNISWCASDEYNYEQIIQLYENRSKPLFIFNVTMQNHGGYNVPLINDVTPISIEEKYAQHGDVINYLTLMRESDKAFAELIEYFSRQADPVIVCMFGDHQPSLDSAFISSFGEYDGISNAQKRYITPYVIWSNYELDVSNVNKDMSLNYLGANLLNVLGIHTEYIDFLLDLEKEIPVINRVAYQTSDGMWHELNEEADELNNYKIVQYYELFER